MITMMIRGNLGRDILSETLLRAWVGREIVGVVCHAGSQFPETGVAKLPGSSEPMLRSDMAWNQRIDFFANPTKRSSSSGIWTLPKDSSRRMTVVACIR